ncbi:hypothetical protein CIK99_07970 [Prevotella sp. P5-92]|uniref:BspA family leucine-rich repeat surface protein n=1 Tax=Prevotella sp. P5-92 TaxID=2024222 RepID=UPI000B9736B0|nr:BspA family leucine-rich repeat surface protein [Prevotella sp. P5-92]OYP57238.1 hypothetical protein CIK99_07970 [Prevotella sp. P5-92]
MTKKRNLTAFMIAIMIMLFSLPANAQEAVGYAQWNESSTTLTFYGGTSVPTGAYELNNNGWISKTKCTTVVFDESFKNVRPTTCNSWFYNFTSLETIEGIENLNTEEVTDMNTMFSGCKKLNSLDLSSFNTEKVENMAFMFQNCSGLTSLDLSSFNTAKVKKMYYMFDGCSGLISLDLSSFNTANVDERMDRMFQNCSGLTSLDLSSFNTAKVKNMSWMFNGCKKLNSLDLSSFNTANVTNMEHMFYGCSGLTKIYVSDYFTTDEVTNSYSNQMFYGCNQLEGTVKFDSNKTDKSMANCTSGYFSKSNLTPYVKWNASTKVLTFKVANYTTGTNGEYKLNEGNSVPGWYINEVKNNCTKVVFTPSFTHAKPVSCYRWFKEFGSVNTIQGIEYLNTEKVEDMYEMFYGCSGLSSLDLSKFNTANVTNMNYMFSGCSGLTSLDLSKFNTANVKYMNGMFSGCSSLTSLDLSSFNTANVENMNGMFNSCSKLSSLDLSKFNTAKVEDISRMFYGCSKLSSLNLSKFNTAKETDMSYMFYNCSGLTSLDLSKFNTANVTDMSCMFYNCSGLTSLDLSSFNTAKVEYMNYMFNGCSSLESLDLSSFNTAKVKNMSYMFKDCKKLTSLDLSSFNTAKVENMSYMFSYCSGLTTIYASDAFTTDHKPSGSYMFKDCTNLVGAASYSDSGNTGKSMANYNTGYFKTYFTLGENKVELCGNPLTTKNLDLSGDYDFTPKYEFKANEATYSRDLSSSNSTWFSLCLPFAYTPDNFTAYQLKGATANAVEIEEITGTIDAGTPVLFKFKDGVKNEEKKINISANKAEIVKAPVDGTAVTGDDGSSLQLCGTYQTKTFSKDADGNAFILLNNKLMNPAKMYENTNVTKVSVKPFRAYMTMTASAESSAQTSSARAFSIGRGDEGNEGTSAIDLLNSVATDDAEYYDINGRRIDAPIKGVNIVRRGNKTMKLIIK